MAKVTGSFTGTGSSQTLPGNSEGSAGLTLSGFGVGTVNLQWSFDGGTTWTTLAAYTADADKVVRMPSDNILYRLNCSAYTSGTIVYGLAS